MRKTKLWLVAMLALVALTACGGYESEDGLSARDERLLVGLGRIEKGEHVLFYTSRGRDIEEAGAFFTETRVVAYWVAQDKDEANENIRIDLKDVTDLKLKAYKDSWTRADYITVTWGKDGKKEKIYLQSDGEKFSTHFYDALKKQWEKVQAERR